MYKTLIYALFDHTFISKNEWKKMTWDKAWDLEESQWKSITMGQDKCSILFKTLPNPRYLTWWHLSDLNPRLTKKCEDMAKIVCANRKLKADMRTRDLTFGARICVQCDLGIEETAFHMAMQCPANEERRNKMFNEIQSTSQETRTEFSNLRGEDVFLSLTGKNVTTANPEDMLNIWTIIPALILQSLTAKENNLKHNSIVTTNFPVICL